MAVSTTSTSHAVYHTFYHIVWSTKYRRKVLLNGVDEELKHFLTQLIPAHGYVMGAVEVMPDHVHLSISFSPKHSIASVVKDIKGSSARHLFARCPRIKGLLWGGHLWNPSYYVGTAGSVSKEAVAAYIAEQKTE